MLQYESQDRNRSLIKRIEELENELNTANVEKHRLQQLVFELTEKNLLLQTEALDRINLIKSNIL